VLISQAFGWADTMFMSTRIRGVDLVPKYNSSHIYPLIFVVFVIIGNIFITNLFVGVVVSTYNREKDQDGNNYLLSKH
jgi:hypothetical protein